MNVKLIDRSAVFFPQYEILTTHFQVNVLISENHKSKLDLLCSTINPGILGATSPLYSSLNVFNLLVCYSCKIIFC